MLTKPTAVKAATHRTRRRAISANSGVRPELVKGMPSSELRARRGLGGAVYFVHWTVSIARVADEAQAALST
jgi:hypothetical protein